MAASSAVTPSAFYFNLVAFSLSGTARSTAEVGWITIEVPFWYCANSGGPIVPFAPFCHNSISLHPYKWSLPQLSKSWLFCLLAQQWGISGLKYFWFVIRPNSNFSMIAAEALPSPCFHWCAFSHYIVSVTKVSVPPHVHVTFTWQFDMLSLVWKLIALDEKLVSLYI